MIVRVATAATAAAVPALLAFRSGGYFPSEWGLEIGFFVLVSLLVVIVADTVSMPRGGALVLLALLGLALWSLASILWSPGADAPVLTAERTLVYVAAVAALLLSITPERTSWLLGGVLAGLLGICLYALATRLSAGTVGSTADAIGGRRLDAPIGYANALGTIAALAILLALGFGLHERKGLRAAAGAALVPLAATLYFTLSRGAVVALAVGVVSFAAVQRSGAIGALLPLAAAPAAAVALAYRSPLLDGGLSLGDARHAGHHLALELAALLLLGGAAGVLARPLASRMVPLAVLAVAAAVAAVAVAVARVGPVHLLHRAAHGFGAQPAATQGQQSRRLLSTSSSWRSEYWSVALTMVRRAPVLGEGAGSYERWWLQERSVATETRNAHNLFLETLAELGPIGLGLLLLALAVPLVAGWERTPVAAGALGAYAAWLAHNTLDWDWQIPAVTLVGLAAGGTLLASGRGETRVVPLTTPRRLAGVAALLSMLAVALVAHVGNRALDRGQAALDAGRNATAAAEARRARRWMPWAAEPWQLLGEAQLNARQIGPARQSLSRAIRRNPDDWATWYDVAAVTTGGSHERALAHARRLDPLEPALRPRS